MKGTEDWRKILKNLFFLIFILLLSITFGCKDDGKVSTEPKDTIKIGVVYPQTGGDKQYGFLEGNAYKLAVDEINKEGGINGVPVEIITKDDLSSPDIAKSVTKELIEEDSVLAIVGTFDSACTLAMSEVCREKETPFLCSSGAVDEITRQGNEWVFRIAATSRDYAHSIIDFLEEEYRPKTIAIICTEGYFSSKTSDYLEKYVKEKKLNLVLNEKYTKGMINFKPLLEKIKEKEPDLLYVIVYKGDASLLMKQAEEVDLNPAVYAGAGIGFTDPYFIPEAGKNAEYVITLSQWDKKASYPGSDDFVRSYTEKFNCEPDYHAALAYSAFTVLIDAIRRSPSMEKEDIRTSLKNTKMTTIVGNVEFQNFDSYTNQNKHRLIVLQIQGGEFYPVYPAEISKKKPVLPVPPWSER